MKNPLSGPDPAGHGYGFRRPSRAGKGVYPPDGFPADHLQKFHPNGIDSGVSCQSVIARKITENGTLVATVAGQ
jgi:hypothetical protein